MAVRERVVPLGSRNGSEQEDSEPMRIEESVEIDRPPEEVFAYVADPEHLPEWSGIVQEVRKEGQGQPREGDRFTTAAKFLGRRFETPMEVVAHEPPRRHSDRSTGGPFEQEYTFVVEETEGGGTRLTQVAEGEPGGFFRLVGPLLEMAGRRQFRADLETLKDLLEARS
jgi:uncharacterized protein YndB with AHSA1/START domain